MPAASYNIIMSTITLPKTEYLELKKRAAAYDVIINVVSRDLFASPPEKKTKKVLAEFKKTGLYSKAFLKDLAAGLKNSSYFVK